MKKSSPITRNTLLNQSIRIVKDSLTACLTDDGIVAGPHHFVDLWARDSFFSTFGLYDKRALKSSENTLNSFIQHQRADGLIPYRVMRSKSTLAKYFGKPTLLPTTVPNFYSHMSLGLVPDGGLMTIIAAAEYIRRTKDMSWLKSQYQSLQRAIDWYDRAFSGSLISEWFQCEWADGVLKVGKTLYTNVLYVKAMRDMVYIAGLLKHQNDKKRYDIRTKKLYSIFHAEFWNGTYFVDWIDWKKQQYFASHANFLAIIFGISTKKESQSILEYAQTHTIASFTHYNVYPSYPIWRIPLIQIIGGVPGYHNRGMLWLQPGITYALALHATGNHTQAKNFLLQIAQQIVKYADVYEVYETGGTPVKRTFYTSEGPFAWSSGLFLWATHEIFGDLQ